ncbi:MAG TPA: NlpC/P60 family protein [Stackebrandtia sp.]|uniref:C40 family peptidase n=1 Tax=Stackebrandtia sp. TaxID=2023065 RepID=UPI002D75132D|nr:NlpC/P60 family protein [Stackebrandtia sp.]HZE41274.1 NlpC/P60 family protein [Stackebrandtia sp.]
MPKTMPSCQDGHNHPHRKSRRGVFAKSAALSGVACAAVATILAFPAASHADPGLEQQLKSAKAHLKDAKSTLSHLKHERGDAQHRVAAANKVLDDTDASITDVSAAMDDKDAAFDKLSDLVDYSRTAAADRSHTEALRDATADRVDSLDDKIADAKHKVSDLTAKRDKLAKKLEAASAGGSGSGEAVAGAGSGGGATAVAFAKAQLGEPYVFGASGPDSWDCSGLTMMAWQQAGVSLNHGSFDQADETQSISRDQLRPGDLIFYNGGEHVGIYIGGGKVIHAPTEGDVVKISPVDMMPPEGFGRP